MTPTVQATPSQIAAHKARKARLARIADRSRRVLKPTGQVVRTFEKKKATPCNIYAHAIGPIIPKSVIEARALDARVKKFCRRFQILGSDKPNQPSLKQIANEVCEKHNLTMVELFANRRERQLVSARHEAFWRMKKETTHSLTAIGRFFKRDHTTVLHGIRKHQERLDAGEVV